MQHMKNNTLEAQCLCCIHVNHLPEWAAYAIFGRILRQGQIKRGTPDSFWQMLHTADLQR